MNNISIIIPFVNEKEEVSLTVDSIIEYSENIDYEIILINDASDDGYNYKELLGKKKNVIYYENKHRIGVAECRNMGISLSKHNAFLLLDAHMRFYSKNTLERFLEVLSNNEKSLVCCRTRGIGYDHFETTPFGAFIDFWGQQGLNPTWNTKDSDLLSSVTPIPCLLGATYAGHKSFWLFLGGLTGLISYGSDEAYISLKAWLSGGRCLIIKDVIIGHLYRKNSPYKVMNIDFIYNKVLVSLLTLPNNFSLSILINLKNKTGINFDYSLLFLYKNLSRYIILKEHYQKILIEPFHKFHNFNRECASHSGAKIKINDEINIKELVLSTISNMDKTDNYGLYDGKMGIAILLFLYSRKTNNTSIKELAEIEIDKIINYLERADNKDLSYENGILGIAWGINFLNNEGFIDGDINEILSSFDELVLGHFNEYDWSFDTGILGVAYYAMIRASKDKSLLTKHKLFFTLLTKILKQKFIYGSYNIQMTGFPIIVLFYLGFIENKYFIIDDLLSFSTLLCVNNNIITGINKDSNLYEKIYSLTIEQIL